MWAKEARVVSTWYAHLKEQKNFSGEINYLISSILDRCFSHNLLDVRRLECVLYTVIEHFYTSKIVPYEKKKIIENGEVYFSIEGDK